MNIEVLRLECKDYSVSLNTNEVLTPWKRFKARAGESAETYCDYASSEGGTLYLTDCATSVLPAEGELSEVGKWEERHPVVFETREYQFVLDFKNLNSKSPKIIHPMKSVVDGFTFTATNKDKEGHYSTGLLTGTVKFLNSPGRFRLGFEYADSEGRAHTEWVELDVVSPKLDTKKDLEGMNRLINEEYENYVFKYLTLTFSSLHLERSNANNEVIWLSIFQSIIDNYFKAVRFVVSRPNNKQTKREYYAHPERIKKWSNREAERFKERGNDADTEYFRYAQTEHTKNTVENRFVKYTLAELSKKFERVFESVKRAYGDDFAGSEEMEKYRAMFAKLKNNTFFRGVGNFEGFRQESAVMQQRAGYSNIYKYWLMLRCGLELQQGETNIGLRQIWELYEIWCFIVLKRLIIKILGINPDPESEDFQNRVHENKDTMSNLYVSDKANSKSVEQHKVSFVNGGDTIDLTYQRIYGRKTEDMRSLTTEQKPDFVLNIRKPDGFVLTYLFDAKYRLIDDKDDIGSDDSDINFDVVDYPVNDAINQMHRYRDAIYYSLPKEKRPTGKEVIGGYILYPGRSTSDQKLEERYFSKSIESVNIGAFPLLPSRDGEKLVECDKLENFLRKLILERTETEQVSTAIPQKGLSYTVPADDIVLVGYYKSKEDYKLIIKEKIYYIRVGLRTGSLHLSLGFDKVSYIFLYHQDNMELFKTDNAAPRLVSGKDLRDKEFEVEDDLYLVYGLGEKLENFDGKSDQVNLKKSPNPYRKDPYITTLKELLKTPDSEPENI